MSITNVTKFLTLVKSDAQLQQALAEAESPEQIADLGGTLGFTFTAAELCTVHEQIEAESLGQYIGRKVIHNVEDGTVIHRITYVPGSLRLATSSRPGAAVRSRLS